MIRAVNESYQPLTGSLGPTDHPSPWQKKAALFPLLTTQAVPRNGIVKGSSGDGGKPSQILYFQPPEL